MTSHRRTWKRKISSMEDESFPFSRDKRVWFWLGIPAINKWALTITKKHEVILPVIQLSRNLSYKAVTTISSWTTQDDFMAQLGWTVYFPSRSCLEALAAYRQCNISGSRELRAVQLAVPWRATISMEEGCETMENFKGTNTLPRP